MIRFSVFNSNNLKKSSYHILQLLLKITGVWYLKLYMNLISTLTYWNKKTVAILLNSIATLVSPLMIFYYIINSTVLNLNCIFIIGTTI